MAAQAFFYNAIFFTYALVLTDFYGIAADHVGWYMLPFAAGNFLGPLLLGPPVRHARAGAPMIAFTYAISGVLLAITRLSVPAGAADRAAGRPCAWMVIFFFASAAASSAYLTVSETFPLEMRALAIAVFYAVGTGIGGVAGPALFGALVEIRLAAEHPRRLSLRLGPDARGGGHRLDVGRRGRAETARGRRPSAGLQGLARGPGGPWRDLRCLRR